MAKRMVEVTECNGCGRNTADDEIQIVASRLKYNWADISAQAKWPTIDMCNFCEAEQKYICTHCRKVHGDDNPCDYVAAIQKEYA